MRERNRLMRKLRALLTQPNTIFVPDRYYEIEKENELAYYIDDVHIPKSVAHLYFDVPHTLYTLTCINEYPNKHIQVGDEFRIFSITRHGVKIALPYLSNGELRTNGELLTIAPDRYGKSYKTWFKVNTYVLESGKEKT